MDSTKNKYHGSLLIDMSIGGISAATASIISNPPEVIKTRFQMQQELGKGKLVYSSVYDCVHKIWKYEGLRGIQSGLSAAIMYQLLLNSTRFGCFEYINNLPSLQAINGSEPLLNFIKNFTIASTCGAIAGFVNSPLYLVKTRLQMINLASKKYPELSIGYQYPYTGTFNALHTIYKEHGLSGLYRNSSLSGLRMFFAGGLQLSVYDQVKYFWQSLGLQGVKLHLISSVISTFLVCIAINPIDVVLTRCYFQNENDKKYSGAFDCFKKTIQIEGIRGIYKGFWPSFGRLAPHCVLSFVIFEKLKHKIKGPTQRDDLITQRLMTTNKV